MARTHGPLRRVGSAALAKVVVMGLSGVLAILTARLILREFGVEAYAQYGLLSTLPSLLPFADLGIATVVINSIAASADPKNDQTVRRSLTTAFRILLVSATVIAAAAAAITAAGLWQPLLGTGLQGGTGATAALVCACIFAVVLPLTVAQRALVGLGRATRQIAAQAVVAPLILATVATAVALQAPVGGYLAVASYVANGAVSVICIGLVIRALGPQFLAAVRDVPRIRSVPNVPFLATTWPMVAQMVALPIAMQSHRIILSRTGTVEDLAEYNLGSQLFGIILQTVAAAGVALWPIYAKARAAGRHASPYRETTVFFVVALALALLLAFLAPFLVRFIAGTAVVLDVPLLVAFTAFVAVQAAKYPTGMYMTDARGLRFQVLPTILVVVITLGATIPLVPVLGAAAPVAATATAVLVCQVVPNLLYVRADIRRRRTSAADASRP